MTAVQAPPVNDAARAEARATAYGLFSFLVPSPMDEAPGRALPPNDLQEALDELAQTLPYPFDTAGLAVTAEALGEEDAERLSSLWSGLFEVGEDGPAIALREEHAENHQGKGTKEEVVRFYDFFGYRLDEKHQWCPDHLTILLEFLYFLCFREAEAIASEVEEEVISSYGLAQLEFLERHLLNWIEGLSEKVGSATDELYFIALFEALASFLASDYTFRNSTVKRE